MKVKVSHISNEWKPVRIGREEGYNMVVVTQALESGYLNGISITPNKTLRLNLNSEQKNKQDWLNVLKEGNVLDVNIRQTGRVVAVDKYSNPRLIKATKEGVEATDNNSK